MYVDEHADAEVAARVAGGDATAADADANSAADNDDLQLMQRSTPHLPATQPRRCYCTRPHWRKVHSSRMICFIEADFQFRRCRRRRTESPPSSRSAGKHVLNSETAYQ